jgi:transcription termination factor Rho
LKVNSVNFQEPEKVRHKIHFDNLTPLYPDERLEDGNRGSDDQGSIRPGSSTWSRRSAKASVR